MAGPAARLDRYIEGSPCLHFRFSGAEEGRTVVMLHSSTQHVGVWDEVVPVFSGFRVAALDLRGHGRSGHSDACAADDYISDVERLLDTLGGSSIALVGHSMGSLVAMRYSARHPGAVWAVAFIDIDARPPDLQGNSLRIAGSRPGRAFDTAA